MVGQRCSEESPPAVCLEPIEEKGTERRHACLAPRLSSTCQELHDRARKVARDELRQRRMSTRGSSTTVHPEGVLSAVDPSADNPNLECESYKYDGEESRIHFERRMELDDGYRKRLEAVTLLLVVAIGMVVAIIATGQLVVAGLLHKLASDLVMAATWPAHAAASANATGAYNVTRATSSTSRADPRAAMAGTLDEGAVEQPHLLLGFSVYWAINSLLIMCASLLSSWAPQAAGSGLPIVKAYLNGLHQRRRWATVEALIAKTIGITLVVSTMMPLGREGPMVHIGAMAGAVISRSHWFGLERFFELRLPKNQREWVGIGAAAGVAAAFNAPLGGILYSFEELTWRSFLCSVVVATALGFFVNYIPLMHKESFVLGLDDAQHLAAPPVDSLAFLWVAVLSAMGGAIGGLYNAIVVRINRWRRGLRLSTRGRLLEAGCLSSVAFVLYFWLPVALGCEPCPPSQDAIACLDGHSDGHNEHASIWLVRLHCPVHHYSPLATLLHSGQEGVIKHLLSRYALSPYPPLAMTVMLVCYACLAVVCMGISVPAGNFVPGIIIGALTGRLAGELLASANVPGAGAEGFAGIMALVGATAVLGGMTRMTITIAVILVEITDDVHLMPTIMLSLSIAKAVGDRISLSFDDSMIELMSLPMLEDIPPAALEPLVARDVMARPVLTVKERMLVGDLVGVLSSNAHNGFPVVGGGGHIVGLLERRQLLVLLEERVWQKSTWALSSRTRMRFILSHDGNESERWLLSRTNAEGVPIFHALSSAEKECTIDLRPFMDASPILVTELTPLPRVYRMFNEIGVRHLPIVDKHHRICGIIVRKDLQHDSIEKRLEEFWTSKRGGRWANSDAKEETIPDRDENLCKSIPGRTITPAALNEQSLLPQMADSDIAEVSKTGSLFMEESGDRAESRHLHKLSRPTRLGGARFSFSAPASRRGSRSGLRTAGTMRGVSNSALDIWNAVRRPSAASDYCSDSLISGRRESSPTVKQALLAHGFITKSTPPIPQHFGEAALGAILYAKQRRRLTSPAPSQRSDGVPMTPPSTEVDTTASSSPRQRQAVNAMAARRRFSAPEAFIATMNRGNNPKRMEHNSSAPLFVSSRMLSGE